MPTSLRDVRAFIGMASYYRRFIKKFAQIAQPLHCLTRKGAIFSWTEQCQGAFEQLKMRLATSPVLCYPTVGKAFTLETDVSKAGLGAVLSQIQADNKEHPCSCLCKSGIIPPGKPLCYHRIGNLGCCVGYLTFSCLPLWPQCPGIYRPLCCQSSVTNT